MQVMDIESKVDMLVDMYKEERQWRMSTHSSLTSATSALPSYVALTHTGLPPLPDNNLNSSESLSGSNAYVCDKLFTKKIVF